MSTTNELTPEIRRFRQQRAHKYRRRWEAHLAHFGDGSTSVSVSWHIPGGMKYGTEHSFPREHGRGYPRFGVYPGLTERQIGEMREAVEMARLAQEWEDAMHPAPPPLPCHYCGCDDERRDRGVCC